MTVRTVDDALAWAKTQNDHATQNWHGMCQSFVRQAYNLPGGFGSAYAQWLGLDDEDRHEGGHPADAPIGAALFYKGSNPYGHIMLAARGDGAWSNDLVRDGLIDYVDRDRPTTEWGQTYLGWGSSINGVKLPLHLSAPTPPTHPTPPEPDDDKPYLSLRRAITKLQTALERAQHFGDHDLAKSLTHEIADLKAIEKKASHQ